MDSVATLLTTLPLGSDAYASALARINAFREELKRLEAGSAGESVKRICVVAALDELLGGLDAIHQRHATELPPLTPARATELLLDLVRVWRQAGVIGAVCKDYGAFHALLSVIHQIEIAVGTLDL